MPGTRINVIVDEATAAELKAFALAADMTLPKAARHALETWARIGANAELDQQQDLERDVVSRARLGERPIHIAAALAARRATLWHNEPWSEQTVEEILRQASLRGAAA